jgi:hypothetical protein
MSWFLACPICDKPITKLRDCDRGEAACPDCRYLYQFTVGRLHNWSTRVETPPPGKKPPQPCRHYELRLEQPEGQIMATRITLPGETDALPLCQGDEIAVVSVKSRRQQQTVLTVINRTAQTTLQVAQPDRQSRRFALGVGAVATLVGGTLLTVVAPHALPLAWLASLPLGMGAGIATRRRLSVQTALSQLQKEQLQRQGELLLQQVELQERLQSLEADQAAHGAVAQKFKALKERLVELPADLQQDRLELVHRVLVILEQQLAYDQQLITGYSQIIDALDIEYEATRLTAELPEELVLNFNRRLAELQAVEQQRQQLTAELAMRKVAF